MTLNLHLKNSGHTIKIRDVAILDMESRYHKRSHTGSSFREDRATITKKKSHLHMPDEAQPVLLQCLNKRSPDLKR